MKFSKRLLREKSRLTVLNRKKKKNHRLVHKFYENFVNFFVKCPYRDGFLLWTMHLYMQVYYIFAVTRLRGSR